MIQEVQKIEKSIRERRDSDIKLTNYWISNLLLGPITFGIYPLVQYCKQILRVDKFIKRKRSYYEGIISYTEKFLLENQSFDENRGQFLELKNYYLDFFQKNCKEINLLVSLLLSIVTLGIYGIYVTYRLNRIWNDLQNFEDEFYDKLNKVWNKVEIVKYPINFKADSNKNRSFLLNIVLSFVSFGFWGIIWGYKMWTDPDNLYGEFHSAEDFILASLRK